MKKFLLYLLVFAGSITTAAAQDQPVEGEQKIKAYYVAYITKELNLTEDEAQKFWPLHNQFDQEMKTINDKADQTEIQREEASLNVKKKYQDTR
jgi:hypothetical protein